MYNIKKNIDIIVVKEIAVDGDCFCEIKKGNNIIPENVQRLEESQMFFSKLNHYQDSALTKYNKDLTINIIDPKRLLKLIVRIIRDGIKYHKNIGSIIKSVFNGTTLNSMIINGEVVYKGKIPSEEEFLGYISKI